MSDSDAALPPNPFSARTRAVLLRGPFGRYAAGETVSMTGTWMQSMAQSWVMTGLSNSAFMLSLVNACASLPMLALTMYGGTVADRYDKRKILVATNLIQATLAVAVGYLVMTGRIQIWHVLTASVLLGISASFEMPSSAAFVPELVEREQIAAAVAIDRSIFHGTRTIGPAAAGLLIAVWGTASAFYANALSFFALIAAVVTSPPRAVGTAEEEKERSSGMKAGILYVRQDRPTLAMLGLMASNSLWIFPFMAVIMPLYARNVIRLDSAYTGYLMSVSGIGSLAASIGLLSVPRPQRLAWLAGGSAVIVLALAALGLSHSFWQAAGSLIALAVGTSLNYGLANITIQERAPAPLRGRISALAMIAFVGIMPFAAMTMAKLSDLANIRIMMLVCAAGYAMSATVILSGPGRQCTREPETGPVPPPVNLPGGLAPVAPAGVPVAMED